MDKLKTSFLVDTADHAIFEVHCSAKWPNDAIIGPKLTARIYDKIDRLAADKGYDSKAFRDTLRSEGIRPHIKHHLYNPEDHAHNDRLSDEMYNQQTLSETVNSTIKRSISENVSSQARFRQFREIVFMASVHDIRQSISRENDCRIGVQ